MILEGLMTTVNEDGGVNLSPMGPVVNASMTQFILRPFKTSRTYNNLVRQREAVFHVTDDVDMIARSAVGELRPLPEMEPAGTVTGWVIQGACRWYELQLHALDDQAERAEIVCQVVDQGRLRDFFGFNRAKHAVLEAAILATRTEFLPADEILADMRRLETIVAKTAGKSEQCAFEFLDRHIRTALGKGTS